MIDLYNENIIDFYIENKFPVIIYDNHTGKEIHNLIMQECFNYWTLTFKNKKGEVFSLHKNRIRYIKDKISNSHLFKLLYEKE